MRNGPAKLITSAAVAIVFAAAATQATAALLDFVVDEEVIPRALVPPPVFAPTFVADLIRGPFSERFSIGDGTYVAGGFGDFASYFGDEGATRITSLLTLPPAPRADLYSLYAVFTSTGSITAEPIRNYTGILARLEIFADPESDTVKTLSLPVAGGSLFPGRFDDLLIGFATHLESATGTLLPAGGSSFSLIFDDFTLTAFGTSYLTLPIPFYTRVALFGESTPLGGLTIFEAEQTNTGTLRLAFVAAATEPGVPALLAAAVIAFGLARRIKADPVL